MLWVTGTLKLPPTSLVSLNQVLFELHKRNTRGVDICVTDVKKIEIHLNRSKIKRKHQ